MRRRPNENGFTLLELVAVMVVVGVLGGTLGMFAPQMLANSQMTVLRAALADQGSLALSRIQRDLRGALPNSIRTTSSGGKKYLEFVPGKGGGRYRMAHGSTSLAPCPVDDAGLPPGTANDILSVGVDDSCFKSLGAGDTSDSTAGDWLVVFNQGDAIADADFYATGGVSGGNKAKVVSIERAADESRISFEKTSLKFESSGRRFHLVGEPVTYECDPVSGVLSRHEGYGIHASQPTSFAGGKTYPLLLGVSGCDFIYSPGVLAAKQGVVSMMVDVSRGTERLSVFSSVRVSNVP